jgi:iron complex outermembrane recepter protein
MAGASHVGNDVRRRTRAAMAAALASSVSLLALTAAGTVLAQGTPTPETQDLKLPEVRVISTTPAPASSPRRAPSSATTTRPARAPAPTASPAPATESAPVTTDPTVIDRDKVPANTQTLTADDFTRANSPNVTDALFQRVPGVSLSDPNGNGVQQAIKYRGFSASPLQGTPQGLAVYMGGIRLNEAFGDSVNFDLIPTNAIDRADVWSNNPVFGLNALGGAINLGMKNGFTYQGNEVELLGGSFGRTNVSAQAGGQSGDTALYLAAQGMHDDGWRQRSPADVGRFYGDLGWRGDKTELHAVLALASTSFGAIAATPVQLLAQDWTSVYTNPQTTRNQMGVFALNGKHSLTDAWTLQGNVYVRGFRQQHLDGNDGNFERCSNAADPQFRNHLCMQDDGFPRPTPVTPAFRDQFAILDQNNNPIPCPPGAGNTCAGVPYATLDRTKTKATTVGGSLQATDGEKWLGHDNRFVVGASVDHSKVDFNAASELAFIYPDLTVAGNPNIPGMGSIIHTLGGFGYGPVGLVATSTYYGLFATDTFDITRELSVTAGARLNVAKISMADQLGTAPELNTSPTYERLNPVAGLTYKFAPWLNLYGGYSESNRAPTLLELGCADRDKPCLIEGFLVSDPPLKQVVGKTYEAGMRGTFQVPQGRLEWKLGLFRTDTFDDILQLASAIQGRGFFTNVPQTRRQGLEANVEYRAGQWLAHAGYSYIDATYQFSGDLASPNNPLADADGNVHVTPGKHIPMIPMHQFKAGADYAVTPEWTVGGNLVAVGSQFFDGDQANQNPKLPAYAVVNLRTSYQINKSVQLFGFINNLFNTKYLLHGTFFEPQGVANSGLPIALTDQRTEVPGQPLSIYAGVRVKL